MLEGIKARAEQQARLMASKSQPKNETSPQLNQTVCSKCNGAQGVLRTWYEDKDFTKLVDGEWITETRQIKCESWEWCTCYLQKRTLAASKITEDFKEKGFKNFSLNGRPDIVKELFQVARDYALKFKEIRKERRNSIAFLGNPGVGKTHLLMAVCNNLMHQNIPVIYFPWVEGWNEIKDDFDLLNKRVNMLKECDLLFIDDLFKGRPMDEQGRGGPTPFQLEQLFGIVNYRYLEKKPIMISSEWSFEKIVKLDEGIGSRLVQMCKDYTVEVEGNPFELNYRLVEGD
ncbi:DnaA ATPase domain-containing protein [Brevibacillus borstelensis]|uniref:DnaA ATPase domain-containing protein n=1 Tax=Brevibacillus borstelensis TaxID=45462 RepID=UPI0030BB0E89